MEGKHAYTDSFDGDDHKEPFLNSRHDTLSPTNNIHQSNPRGLANPWIQGLRQYSLLLISGMLGIIILLQLLIWHDIRTSPRGTLPQVGGDFNGMGPTFSTKIVKWDADPEFTPLNATEFLKPEVQARWESLFPVGAGFVGPDASVYNSTSVTHQIHCVYIMGKIFAAVLTGSPNMPEPNDYEAHFLHCVDYMRQAAMCAGDLAIEPRGKDGQPGIIDLENAFNGLHVCKDYTKIKGYLQEQLNDGARNILPLDD